MNCDQIKELIISDYSDKETSPQVNAIVEGHVKSCADCREFLALVRSVEQPFRKAVETKPPEYLWHRIKEVLVTGQEKRTLNVWERVTQAVGAGLIRAPRLAFATTIMTIVVVSAIMFQVSAFQRRLAVQDYFNDQSDSFAYFNTNNQYSESADASGFDSITENLL
jgi:anti-sigma factor RsiW